MALDMVIGAIVEMGIEFGWNKLKRRESVIRTLQRLNLDFTDPPKEFDDIYVYTLVEYGMFKPEPVLNFFRNEFIRQAFRQAFFKDDPTILDREAEEIIQWNWETDELGYIDYDPRLEFARFTLVFNEIIDSSRTPVEVRQDKKLEEIIDKLEHLTSLVQARFELLQQRTILPNGWIYITKDYLEKHRSTFNSHNDVISFYFGRIPLWSDALSDKVPRREVVQNVLKILEEGQKRQVLQMTLLKGAGGEGKTTALRQIVCDLVDKQSGWNVIWHENPETSLPKEFVESLPQTNSTWLFVSDDADQSIDSIFNSVKGLSEKRNIQYLLCCRDIDWRISGAHQRNWGQYVPMFIPVEMGGLSKTDAIEIAKAWQRYDPEGWSKLQVVVPEEAAEMLVDAAVKEASSSDGAFLGAMLRVRFDNDLHSESFKIHVKTLLERLHNTPVSVGSLLDTFAYIAIMHVEGKQILRKNILADVLGCSLRDLQLNILGPMGLEAAVGTSSQIVLTRHKAIAEIALKILEEVYYAPLDDYLIQLISAARRLFIENNYDRSVVPEIAEWSYLSSYFFNKGGESNKLLGIRIAESLSRMETQDFYFKVQYAQLLRKQGDHQRSVMVFRESLQTIKKQFSRAFFYEWATAEGLAGNYYLGVWLCGVSLSDVIDNKSLKYQKDQIIISLNGLSIAMYELCLRTQLKLFFNASVAAVQLGLLVEYSNRTQKTHKQMLNLNARLRNATDEKFDNQTALQIIEKAIVKAWSKREVNLPKRVAPANELTFRELAENFSIEYE